MTAQISQSVPAPPAPPAAPAAPGAAASAPVVAGATNTYTIPRSAADLRALRARRSELSDQLQSATSRRNDLVARMARTPTAAQDGLMQRVRLLDERILRLEQDISSSGEALAATPSEVLVTTTPPRAFDVGFRPRRYDRDALLGLTVAITFAVIAVMVAARLLGFGRGRRALAGAAATQERLAHESAQRLARLEQAVDAIALEVERMSESQRFLTRVLADERPRALADGELATRVVVTDR